MKKVYVVSKESKEGFVYVEGVYLTLKDVIFSIIECSNHHYSFLTEDKRLIFDETSHTLFRVEEMILQSYCGSNKN